MVHTATITYLLNRKEYSLYEQFKKVKGTICMKQDCKWYNGTLKEYGLNLWAYHVPAGFGIFVIRINFKRLIEQQDRIAVMKESETEAIANKFDKLLQEMIPGMPSFYDWKVNRIDYCINIKTPYVEEYIKLLQKSDIPGRMKMIPNEQRNYAFRPGSYYVVSKARNRKNGKTGSTTINFYDKYQELLYQKTNGDTRITDEVLEQGKDVLRLEVQCHKPKTDYLQVKYHMNAKNIHYFLDSYIGYAVLQTALLQVCGGRADFQRIGTALDIIDSLPCTQTKKDRLKKLLHDVAKRTVAKVKYSYIKSKQLTAGTFRAYIKLLEENNINAVTIPRDTHLKDKTSADGLESLWTLFEDSYMQDLTAEPTEEFDIFNIDDFAEEEFITFSNTIDS